MARNRMIKVDFWADEKIAALSVKARLLYIGIWNFADDEGLIRANAAYLRSCVFPYDEDLSIKDIKNLLSELEPFLLFYKVNDQEYALVKNFHKHQVINKPQPSKLPAPDPKNCTKYRDYIYSINKNDCCPVCGEPFTCSFNTVNTSNPSIDHIKPISKGGTHHPSNLRVICRSCNSRKKDKYKEDEAVISEEGNTTVILHDEVSTNVKENENVNEKENLSLENELENYKTRLKNVKSSSDLDSRERNFLYTFARKSKANNPTAYVLTLISNGTFRDILFEEFIRLQKEKEEERKREKPPAPILTPEEEKAQKERVQEAIAKIKRRNKAL